MITTEIRVLATREFAAIDQSFHPRPDLPAELECAVAWASGLWNGAFLSLTNQQIKSITSPVRSSVIIPVDATATQKTNCSQPPDQRSICVPPNQQTLPPYVIAWSDTPYKT